MTSLALDQFLATLQRFVEQESPSGDVERNKAMADLLQVEIERRGGRVERRDGPGYGDHLIGRFEAAEGAPLSNAQPLLLMGHMDTVHPVGSLAEMPFQQLEDRLTGPGVFDMKAGVTLALIALDEVARGVEQGTGPGLAGPVTLLVTCDEEVGSPTSKELIENLARESRATLVLEPSLPGGVVKTARKGVADYDVSVTGVPAHAGIEPDKGASAIHGLVEALDTILTWARPEVGTTISAGMIRGGTARNVIAETAGATVDVRFWSREEADRVDAALRSLELGDPRLNITIGGGVNRYPLEETSASQELFVRAAALGQALGFDVQAGRTGGGSDGNFTSAVGCPTLDGLGPDGGGAHAKHEHVLVAGLPTRISWITRLLESL